MINTKYFKEELKAGGMLTCPCGCDAKMDKRTIEKLDIARHNYGKPVYIAQGATCASYSIESVGRAPTSTHIDDGSGAKGIDIKSKSFKNKADYFHFLSCVINAGFTGIGQGAMWIGAGKDKRLHIDTKHGISGDMRSWVYGVGLH